MVNDEPEDDRGLLWWQQTGATEATRPAWTRLYETDPHKDKHMKLSDMMESKYLRQNDVDDEVTVTVAGLKKVNVARDDEDPEYRWTVKFNEFPKPMVLNVT